MKVRRGDKLVLLASCLIVSFLLSPAYSQEEIESLDGLVKGVRVNVVEGHASYRREETLSLTPGLELKNGDQLKTAKDGRAEILLQPGNLLRLAEDTEVQVLGDEYDRLRLRLQRGSISFELLRHELDGDNFSDRLASGYYLIRVSTPDAEVLALQPGIIRISVNNAGRTEVTVRKGDAILNGQRVKEKRVALVSGTSVQQDERDLKQEDDFDTWCRTRAEILVQSNKGLKKTAPWANPKKEGSEPTVDVPSDEESIGNAYVVSARPGTITYTEDGLEFLRSKDDWQPADISTRFESGDRLRSRENSYTEMTLLPDLYFRLSWFTEIVFEELSNEAISLRLVKGSAILDVPFFDKKILPPIKFIVGQRAITVIESGNYRFDVDPANENVTVRDGKVLLNSNSVGSCRRISNGNIVECGSKQNDNFDWWSKYRGEGVSFNGRAMALRAARIRRSRQRDSGFWYQPKGVDQYTFVPFFSTYFQSPYGGNYTVVLSPRRMPSFMGPRIGSLNRSGGPNRQ